MRAIGVSTWQQLPILQDLVLDGTLTGYYEYTLYTRIDITAGLYVVELWVITHIEVQSPSRATGVGGVRSLDHLGKWRQRDS